MTLSHPAPAALSGPAPALAEQGFFARLWERFEDFLMYFSAPAKEKSDAAAWLIAD